MDGEKKDIKKRGRGRPRKSEIQTAKKPGKVGRPKGTSAIMNDYKARMLASPKSEQIIKKVMDTALNDDHPHQAACMKMVWDRLLPASYFEKDKFASKAPQIDININLGGDSSVDVSSREAVDVEFEHVEESNE